MIHYIILFIRHSRKSKTLGVENRSMDAMGWEREEGLTTKGPQREFGGDGNVPYGTVLVDT